MQNAECRMQNDGGFLTHRSKIFINVPTNLLKVRILPFYHKSNKGHPVGCPLLLARLAGFEPATYRFVAGHSIH